MAMKTTYGNVQNTLPNGGGSESVLSASVTVSSPSVLTAPMFAHVTVAPPPLLPPRLLLLLLLPLSLVSPPPTSDLSAVSPISSTASRLSVALALSLRFRFFDRDRGLSLILSMIVPRPVIVLERRRFGGFSGRRVRRATTAEESKRRWKSISEGERRK